MLYVVTDIHDADDHSGAVLSFLYQLQREYDPRYFDNDLETRNEIIANRTTLLPEVVAAPVPRTDPAPESWQGLSDEEKQLKILEAK